MKFTSGSPNFFICPNAEQAQNEGEQRPPGQGPASSTVCPGKETVIKLSWF